MMTFYAADRAEVENAIRFSTPAGREIDRLRGLVRELRDALTGKNTSTDLIARSKEIVP